MILQALQTHGMILADNGSPWYMSGVPDPHWDNDLLNHLGDHFTGRDFEAVDTPRSSATPTPAPSPPDATFWSLRSWSLQRTRSFVTRTDRWGRGS